MTWPPSTPTTIVTEVTSYDTGNPNINGHRTVATSNGIIYHLYASSGGALKVTLSKDGGENWTAETLLAAGSGCANTISMDLVEIDHETILAQYSNRTFLRQDEAWTEIGKMGVPVPGYQLVLFKELDAGAGCVYNTGGQLYYISWRDGVWLHPQYIWSYNRAQCQVGGGMTSTGDVYASMGSNMTADFSYMIMKGPGTWAGDVPSGMTQNRGLNLVADIARNRVHYIAGGSSTLYYREKVDGTWDTSETSIGSVAGTGEMVHMLDVGNDGQVIASFCYGAPGNMRYNIKALGGSWSGATSLGGSMWSCPCYGAGNKNLYLIYNLNDTNLYFRLIQYGLTAKTIDAYQDGDNINVGWT